MFYVRTNLTVADKIRPSVFPINLLGRTVLVEICEENLASSRIAVGKCGGF